MLYHEFRSSLGNQAAWEASRSDPWPTTTLAASNQALRATVQLRPHPCEIDNEEKRLVWRERVALLLTKMNDLTADCLDLVCSAWLEKPKDILGMVTLQAQDILVQRGLVKLPQGGYRVEQKKEIEEQIILLNNLWLNVDEMTVVTGDIDNDEWLPPALA